MIYLAEIGANPEIQELAATPNLNKGQFVGLLLSLVKSEENRELKNFLEVLLENDRVHILPEIGTQFHLLKNISEGTADAEIISAFPLDDNQL